MSEFIPFKKIPRLSREIVITEKIDGTNAQVFVAPTSDLAPDEDVPAGAAVAVLDGQSFYIRPGSRNRWLTLEADNFNFARWVNENAAELVKLGAGRHFGEWWGQGIRRTYGLKEKRFSLFNVARWNDETPPPACCHVVPVLHRGEFSTTDVDEIVRTLRQEGSCAAPGFMNPEGVIVFHVAANTLFKKTLDRDGEPKALRGAA